MLSRVLRTKKKALTIFGNQNLLLKEPKKSFAETILDPLDGGNMVFSQQADTEQPLQFPSQAEIDPPIMNFTNHLNVLFDHPAAGYSQTAVNSSENATPIVRKSMIAVKHKQSMMRTMGKVQFHPFRGKNDNKPLLLPNTMLNSLYEDTDVFTKDEWISPTKNSTNSLG